MEPTEFDNMSVEELQAYFEGMLIEPLSPEERGRLYDGLRDGEAARGRQLSPETAEQLLRYAKMVRAENARLQAVIMGKATFERIGAGEWGFRWKETTE